MHAYEPATYGDRIADVYDSRTRHLDPTQAVSLLRDLAGDGPVLELGIGTGRVALPLAAAGVQVHGAGAGESLERLAKIAVRCRLEDTRLRVPQILRRFQKRVTSRLEVGAPSCLWPGMDRLRP
jgi:hypothetical protein